MKKRRKRDIPGDEAEMIEQSPLEVGFQFSPESPQNSLLFLFFPWVGESDRAIRFLFFLF